ncbi:MAG: 4Fe-4S binding protein [Anaerolineae bacterium]
MTEQLTLDQLRSQMAAFTKSSPLNRLTHLDGSPMFAEPLLAVADGFDPLFEQYKTLIGPYHLTPREVLQAAEGAQSAASAMAELRVICWALPITRVTRLSNRREDRVPSDRWAFTRNDGEKFNEALRVQLVAWLHAAGYLAAAPILTDLYKTRTAQLKLTSAWSERHALYAAGLGTFSLTDGMITPAGMAMRCGSVVTNLPLPVTPRVQASHLANCLHYNGGVCDACIGRCPAGAISAAGHDKAKCLAYQDKELAPLRARLGIVISGCGLCQTGVPCEDRIPAVKAAAPPGAQ